MDIGIYCNSTPIKIKQRKRKTNNGAQNTLVRDTDGIEAPIKNPNTTPIIVVTTSLAPSFDFLKTPLRSKRKTENQFS